MALIEEVSTQEAQDLAFANGALIVIRTDLIPAVVVPPVTPPTPTGTTRLLLHCDEATFTDSSAYARAMTKVSNPTLSANGKFGSCADFSTGYLTTPDTADLRFGDNDWTIEGWHKVKTADGLHDFICSKGASGNLNNAWYFALISGSTLGFVAQGNSFALSYAYPYYNDVTSHHHISLNRIGTTLKLFVDGAMVASAPYVTPYEGTGALYVGGWNYSTANVGGSYLDEFVINIGSALRSENFTPPTAPFGA